LRVRDGEVERLTAEVAWLRARLADSEEHCNHLRVELCDAGARADAAIAALSALTGQLEELRIGARGAATRIRLAALREAAEVNARLVDFNDPRLAESRDRLLIALEHALDRVAGEWEAKSPEPPLLGNAQARVAFARGQIAGASRQSVSVDIGPFEDFSQLVRFEDAANAIGATGEISIRRFSGGRAQIDVGLSEPVDLLRELEESCDLEFRVRSQSDEEIVLDI
jgi:hypothetical protein